MKHLTPNVDLHVMSTASLTLAISTSESEHDSTNSGGPNTEHLDPTTKAKSHKVLFRDAASR